MWISKIGEYKNEWEKWLKSKNFSKKICIFIYFLNSNEFFFKQNDVKKTTNKKQTVTEIFKNLENKI